MPEQGMLDNMQECGPEAWSCLFLDNMLLKKAEAPTTINQYAGLSVAVVL